MARIAYYTAEKTGVSAEVFEHSKGYSVVVKDTDAGETVGVRIYRPDMLAQALVYAEACCDEGENQPVTVQPAKEEPQDTAFKVGRTYYARSACDYECIYSWEVVKRTDKTIWIQDKRGSDLRARRISTIEGVETIMPSGTYSMAPMLRADRFEE